MRSARARLFAVLALTLLALSPWVGWWPLVPFAAAVLGFLIVDRRVPGSARPEYWFMGAWAFSQLMLVLSVLLTGGPRSVFIPWLAIPAATLAARFNRRGVMVGVAWTALLMVGAAMAVDPAASLETPQLLAVPLTLLAGVVILTVGLMHSDVQHRAAAAIDPLTGVFNREALDHRAAELIEHGRAMRTPVAALMGDLDHFKTVNDEHGHLVGDAVLRAVAETLRATLRTFDHVYRYGGEEFLVLLPGGGREDAAAAAERLRVAVARARPAGVPLTISFGVGVSEDGRVGLDGLLRAADGALYRAKAAGRDRIRVA